MTDRERWIALATNPWTKPLTRDEVDDLWRDIHGEERPEQEIMGDIGDAPVEELLLTIEHLASGGTL